MDRYISSTVGGGIRRRGHPQMCLGAAGMKMVAWGIFLSAPGREEPIRRGNGPLSPTFIGQDGLRSEDIHGPGNGQMSKILNFLSQKYVKKNSQDSDSD